MSERVSAADIKDRKTLEAWLEGRPRADALWIAHRAALRVLPVWGAEMDAPWARKGDLTALPLLRCGLISAVAATMPTADIRETAYAAAAAASYAADAAASYAAAADAADAAADAAAADAAAHAAAHAASYAADAATYAADAAARAAFWAAVRADAEALEAGEVPGKLWPGAVPGFFSEAEAKMLRIWDAEPAARWAFWRRWWAAAVAGQPLDPALQLAIVQGVDKETWKDPDKTAARIAEIEAGFEAEQDEDDSDEAILDRDLAKLPPAPAQSVQATARAMAQHRNALPPAFEAILGYIALEVKRLQDRNYRDAEDAEEAQRQIRVLTTIHIAVERLQALVPSTDEMPQAEAEEAEKLTRLIFRRFRDWPRMKPGEFEDNMADLADSAYRSALVGACAYTAPMLGVAPDKALIAGAVLFGGKKIVDTAKAAKDAFGTKGSGGS